MQSKNRLGFKLDTGDFIFYWDDAPFRKMVLTMNNGSVMQSGYMELPAEDWKDISAWNKDKGNTILNFQGYTEGIVEVLYGVHCNLF